VFVVARRLARDGLTAVTGGTVQRRSMTSAPTGHGDAYAGDATLEVVALGGLREFGMNLMAISYGETCLVIDAGVSFPDVELLGIDLVIPDLTYLQQRRVAALVLTHGHTSMVRSTARR
jgi:mRNA degradation ribonuclease J1/J2